MGGTSARASGGPHAGGWEDREAEVGGVEGADEGVVEAQRAAPAAPFGGPQSGASSSAGSSPHSGTGGNAESEPRTPTDGGDEAAGDADAGDADAGDAIAGDADADANAGRGASREEGRGEAPDAARAGRSSIRAPMPSSATTNGLDSDSERPRLTATGTESSISIAARNETPKTRASASAGSSSRRSKPRIQMSSCCTARTMTRMSAPRHPLQRSKSVCVIGSRHGASVRFLCGSFLLRRGDSERISCRTRVDVWQPCVDRRVREPGNVVHSSVRGRRRAACKCREAAAGWECVGSPSASARP